MAGWRFYLNETEVEEPIGWDGVEFTAKRMESHGMDQPFSTELTFYDLGARLIKAEYDASFINANIVLFIQSDVVTDGVAWSYLGYIDLSMYSEKNVCDTDSWEITVGILEDNFREKFKARMDVEVDLLTLKDLDQNAIDPITLHETRLHCQELYLSGIGNQLTDVATEYIEWVDSWIRADFALTAPIYWDNSDFKGVFGNTLDPTGINYTDTNACFVNNSDFIRNINISLNIDLGARWGVITTIPGFDAIGDSAAVDLSLTVRKADNSIRQEITIFTSSTMYYLSPPSPDSFSSNISYTNDIEVHPGDRVLIFAEWSNKPSTTFQRYEDVPYYVTNATILVGFENTCLTITELNSSADASLAKGLLVHDYLQRLVWILTGQEQGIISDYFSILDGGCEWANMLTTGLYIRNAATIDSLINGCGNTEEGDLYYSIKTTFKKTFEDLSKIFCLGWQYEQQEDLSWKIRIEPVDWFYQMNLMASFENVGEIRQYALTDKLVNNITLGYSDKWKNIAVSGIFEIHTERNYFVKNKAMSQGSSSKLDLKSDIIASGYAIEFSRRLQFLRDDSGSSDRPNDYETFIIALNSGELTFDVTNSGYQLPEETGIKTFAPAEVSYGSNFIAVSNAPITRIYNIPLTPMRNAIRWWKMLGMHTFGLPAIDAKLFFQVGEYYTTYSSEIISSCLEEVQETVLAENMDISKDVLQPAYQEYLFKPIGLEFSYPQTLCGFISMGDPGNGCVSVSSGSFNGLGFIQESANKPEDNSGGTTNFTLYLSNKSLPSGRPYSDGYSDGFE
jgi:hypothetical protein